MMLVTWLIYKHAACFQQLTKALYFHRTSNDVNFALSEFAILVIQKAYLMLQKLYFLSIPSKKRSITKEMCIV